MQRLVLTSIVVLLAMSAPGTSTAAVLPKRPNIVVLYTDDQRWDTLDAMPTVSRLAREGVHFRNSFVTTPVCGPSRVGFFSGNPARAEGITVNEGAASQYDDRHSIAVALQEAGYATALFGKYLNGYRDQFPAVPPGWSEWRVFRDGYFDLFGRGSLHQDPMLSWNGTARRASGRSEDLFAEYAEEFIARNADRPFFLVLSFWAPHVPLIPAERHAGKFEGFYPPKPPSLEERDLRDKSPLFRQQAESGIDLDPIWERAWSVYQELLLGVDDAAARIVAALQRHALSENTIVVFTSDNGFQFGEHWVVGKGMPYEESIRVPLVVWSPALRRHTPRELVLNIDLAPTFAELAGASFEAQGRSLVPLLKRRRVPWRRAFEVEGFAGVEDFRAVRSGLFKWIAWQSGHREVYLLPFDPYEMRGSGRSVAGGETSRLPPRITRSRPRGAPSRRPRGPGSPRGAPRCGEARTGGGNGPVSSGTPPRERVGGGRGCAPPGRPGTP